MNGHAATAQARGLDAHQKRAAIAAGPLGALAVAGLCAVAMAAVWSIAELVPAVHLKDAVLLNKFATLGHPGIETAAEHVLRMLDPGSYVLWGIALVAYALATDRPRVAVAVAVVLALAPVSADVLKPLLAHTHDRVGLSKKIGAASWPSGHATAATALAMCTVLAAPARLRVAVAAVGAAFVAAVGVSLLVLEWHMPSDVVGGVLLATLWMALAIAALRFDEQGSKRPPPGTAQAA